MTRTDRGDHVNRATTIDASDWHLRDVGKLARGHGDETRSGMHDDESTRRAELLSPIELAAGACRSPWRFMRFSSLPSFGRPKLICCCQSWAALHRTALDSSGWLQRPRLNSIKAAGHERLLMAGRRQP